MCTNINAVETNMYIVYMNYRTDKFIFGFVTVCSLTDSLRS